MIESISAFSLFCQFLYQKRKQKIRFPNVFCYCIDLREAVKHIMRGGALKFEAEGRETLTPPKNHL